MAAGIAATNLAGSAASRIREVWSNNLEAEMAALREAIIQYPYVAMVSAFQSRGDNLRAVT